MIVLDTTTDNLQVVLNAAITTNQLQCVSSWRDITTTGYTPGRTVINTNSTTDVNIVAAPAASTQRVIDAVSIYNNDTSNAQVTIKFDANGTEYILSNVSLAPGDRLEYSEKKGWRCFNIYGGVRTSVTTPIYNVSTGLKCIVLDEDQVITSGSSVPLTILKGLTLGVDVGKTYYIKLLMNFSIGTTNDGIGFAISAPYNTGSTNRMFFRQSIPLTTTTEIVRPISGVTTYTPNTTTTAASTAANRLTFEGIYGSVSTTIANPGELLFRAAGDSNTAVLTIKRGTILYYEEVS